MSDAQFPSLPGLTWDIARTPIFSTKVQQSVSGKEQRAAFWSYPGWKWSLSYELLRDDASAELQTLMGFFLARKGAYDSFLYTDPDDSAVVGQVVGTGDGAATTFQLVRAYGGYVEPVTAVDTLTLYKTDWRGTVVQSTAARENRLVYSQQFDHAPDWYLDAGTMVVTPNAAVAPDGTTTATLLDDQDTVNPALVTQAVPAFPAGTTVTCSIYIKQGTASGSTFNCYAAGDAETNASITWSAGVPSTNLGTITPVGNGWYRHSMAVTTIAGGVFAFRFWPTNRGIPSDTGSTYVWGAQLEVGSSPTAYIPTTGAAFNGPDFTLGPTGVVTFSQPPAAGAAITADMTYSWRVRFLEDQAEFSEFMNKLWELQKLEFVSVK